MARSSTRWPRCPASSPARAEQRAPPVSGMTHQRVARRLYRLLDQAAIAAAAPVETFTAVNVLVPDGLLIPDLVLVNAAAAAAAELTVNADDIAAVVEIISPTTEVSDRTLKPHLYAAGGIAHDWQVDLEPRTTIRFGELRHAAGGAYAEQALASSGETVRVERPFAFEIDPAVLSRS